jgi:hypothetical protein
MRPSVELQAFLDATVASLVTPPAFRNELGALIVGHVDRDARRLRSR